MCQVRRLGLASFALLGCAYCSQFYSISVPWVSQLGLVVFLRIACSSTSPSKVFAKVVQILRNLLPPGIHRGDPLRVTALEEPIISLLVQAMIGGWGLELSVLSSVF